MACTLALGGSVTTARHHCVHPHTQHHPGLYTCAVPPHAAPAALPAPHPTRPARRPPPPRPPACPAPTAPPSIYARACCQCSLSQRGHLLLERSGCPPRGAPLRSGTPPSHSLIALLINILLRPHHVACQHLERAQALLRPRMHAAWTPQPRPSEQRSGVKRAAARRRSVLDVRGRHARAPEELIAVRQRLGFCSTSRRSTTSRCMVGSGHCSTYM